MTPTSCIISDDLKWKLIYQNIVESMSTKKKVSGFNERNKYAKIPIKIKVKFLRKVVIDGLSIRDSSTLFNINYSTAKTLIRQYRSHQFEYGLDLPSEEPTSLPDARPWLRCGYQVLGEALEVKSEAPADGRHHFYLKGREEHRGETPSEQSWEKSQKHSVSVLYPKFQIISSISYI